MKELQLNQIDSTTFIKVVNNSLGETNVVNRVCINTLEPGFIYNNSEGELITPQKFALL